MSKEELLGQIQKLTNDHNHLKDQVYTRMGSIITMSETVLSILQNPETTSKKIEESERYFNHIVDCANFLKGFIK